MFERLGSRVSRELCVFVSVWSIVLAVSLVVLSFVTARDRETRFGTALLPDFTGLYVGALVLRDHGPERLYDFDLQEELRRREFPRSLEHERLPYLYAPWFTYLLRPFAELPYEEAAALWLAASLALMIAGIACLSAAFPEILPSERLPLALLLLSFEPFLFECWVNGQVAPFPFAWISAALLLQSRGQPVAAGAMLALLTYKPMQPPLLFALLLVGARWRTLAGVALGGAALFVVSAATFGPSIVVDYPRSLLEYKRMISSSAHLRFWKYTDLQSATELLGPSWSGAAQLLVVPVALVLLVCLLRLWRRSRDEWGTAAQHAWAATLVLMPVLNLYFAVYDVLVAVPGMVLAAAMLRRRTASVTAASRSSAFVGILVMVYVAGWFTPAFEIIRVNLLTVSLLVLGSWILRMSPGDAPASARTH